MKKSDALVLTLGTILGVVTYKAGLKLPGIIYTGDRNAMNPLLMTLGLVLLGAGFVHTPDGQGSEKKPAKKSKKQLPKGDQKPDNKTHAKTVPTKTKPDDKADSNSGDSGGDHGPDSDLDEPETE